jgi:hypothetical protein
MAPFYIFKRTRRLHLVHEVKAILSERGYDKVCHPLEALAQRIEETERNVSRKVHVYKWPGLILLGLIPIISTLLSLLVTGEPRGVALKDVSHPLLFSMTHSTLLLSMSYSLTFLTVLNSIFRPSERFKEACRMGVDFERIKSDFLADLESLPEIEESHLHAIINKFNKLVAPYQKELISMFLPEVAVETKRIALAGRPGPAGAGAKKLRH